MLITVLQIALALLCVALACLHALGIWCLRRAPRLPAAPVPEQWPTLAVIVPACNEADTLASALLSLLAQDYPALQILLVNDRSTDNTGAIAEQLAQTDACLRVIHIQNLPADWLGKVHALQTGLQASASDYVLFTDADIHYQPGALRAAMAVVVANQLDHLSRMPKMLRTGFAQQVFMQAFFVGFIRRLLGAKDITGCKAVVGIGAFNLFKREALARTEGLVWLRMDVLDDLALAALLKNAGARTGVAIAEEQLSLVWYDSVGAVIKGLRKNAFGAFAGYNYAVVALTLLLLPLLMVAPLLALAQVSVWWLSLSGALTLVMLALEAWTTKKYWGGSFAAGLLQPLANLPLLIALVWGAYWARRDGGLYWRDTFYPLAKLKAGRRVSFP